MAEDTKDTQNTQRTTTSLRLARKARHDKSAPAHNAAANGEPAVTRMIAAYATADNRHMELHSWVEDGGTLRDDNHALAILDQFIDCDDRIIREPPTGKRTLFTVTMTVSNTRRGESKYDCDYQRYGDCPLCVVDAGMDLYHEFKRVLRVALKRWRRSHGLTDRGRPVPAVLPKSTLSANLTALESLAAPSRKTA